MSNFSVFYSKSWLACVCLSDNSSPLPGPVCLGQLRWVRTEGWGNCNSSLDTFIERSLTNSQRSPCAGKGQGRQVWTCRQHKYVHILSVDNFIIIPQEINQVTLNTEGYLKAWSCQGHRHRLFQAPGAEARHPGRNVDSSSSFRWHQALGWQLHT